MSVNQSLIKLFLADMGSQIFPLVESNATIASGLQQVNFALVQIELQDHGDVVELTRSKLADDALSDGASLEEQYVACVCLLQELLFRYVVEPPRFIYLRCTFVLLSAF